MSKRRTIGLFVQASNSRWEDCAALFKGRRWGGAIYLAGYVVECLLKAIILGRHTSSSLPREFWHHDIERLVDEAGLRLALQQPGGDESRERLALLYGWWDVSMRYGGTRVRKEDAEGALDDVRVIRLWLLARI